MTLIGVLNLIRTVRFMNSAYEGRHVIRGCTHKGTFVAAEEQPFLVDRTEFGAVPPIRKLPVPEDISERFDNCS